MLSVLVLATASSLITNVADLVSAVRDRQNEREFLISGTVQYVLDPTSCEFLLADDTGTAEIFNRTPTYQTDAFAPGDVLRVSGKIGRVTPGSSTAVSKAVTLLRHDLAPEPVQTTLSDIKSGKVDFRYIQTKGTVINAFRDEIDSNYHYLTLSDGVSHVYVTVYTGKGSTPLDIGSLINANVTITGACCPLHTGDRRFLGRSINVSDAGNIAILRRPSSDPYSVPLADDLGMSNPEDVRTVGQARLVGKVLAVWGGNHMMLKGSNRFVHTIETADSRLPSAGEWVEAAGTLETDLYHLNLSNAIWRPAKEPTADDVDEQPVDVTIRELLSDNGGIPALHTEFHGRTIRLVGTVRDLPLDNSRLHAFALGDGGFNLQVNAEACPEALKGLSTDTRLSVAGICMVKIPNWNSYTKFPHATDITVLIRSPHDIRILSRPSWWTPSRLTAVIGALLVLLIGFVAWNRILNRLVVRRSQELFREQVEHYGADLRVDERTRLAVELHDSLSQVLTGVAMEVEAAQQFTEGAAAELTQHLGVAQKTLKSCRNELRNCLWDLRNQSFEETDMNAAIRRTLLPHVRNVRTDIRFNIPRERFSDNTIHVILRIIRELSVNAIKHGRASALQIAGGIDGDLLLLSVTNNGEPFDPGSAPGIDQGHFGLEGIRERLRKFAGSLEIAATATGRIRAKVTMRIRRPEHAEDQI